MDRRLCSFIIVYEYLERLTRQSAPSQLGTGIQVHVLGRRMPVYSSIYLTEYSTVLYNTVLECAGTRGDVLV